MLQYTIRRLAPRDPDAPAHLLVIFLLLELAPGDPMAQMPLTIPPEVREQMRAALGLNEPIHIRFGLWLWQFFVVEPLHLIDILFGTTFGEGQTRILSLADPLAGDGHRGAAHAPDALGRGRGLPRRRS